jgi:ABC-type Na+ transport system ATPase subunit NatA
MTVVDIFPSNTSWLFEPTTGSINSREGSWDCFGGDKGFFERLFGRENLHYFGILAGLASGHLKKRIEEVLTLNALSDRADGKVATYSVGMRQRLHPARALVGELSSSSWMSPLSVLIRA